MQAEAHLADKRVAAVIVQSPGSTAVGAAGHIAIGIPVDAERAADGTNTNGVHSGSAPPGPWMHSWSVRPALMTCADACMLLANRSLPVIEKHVLTLPLDDPVVQLGPADANAELAPANSAIAQTDVATGTTFRRVSLTESS